MGEHVLLQRLSNDLKNQNWLSVAIELIVVAAGIFMGLQASDWNDKRVERTLERGYLVRLHTDISDSVRLMEGDNGFMEKQLSKQKIILAALDACDYSQDDKASIEWGINTLGWVAPPRLFRRTIDDLTVSGRIDIIQNAQIKSSLARLVGEVDMRDSIMETSYRTMEPYRRLIDEQVRYDISSPLHGGSLAVAVDFDIKKLCAQPQNAAAVSAVSFNTRTIINDFRQLLNLYKDFLPLLESELQSRWGHSISGAE
jgi:hypothetical protein